MADDLHPPPRGSPVRRLSQIFDPLSRLSELTASSAPTSPRLLPRRSRLQHQYTAPGACMSPPPPPPRPGHHVHLQQHHVHPPQVSSSVAASLFADLLDGEACGGGINWQERCLELQLELHRCRNDSERVRHALGDKNGSC